MGIAKTGKKIEITGVAVYRIAAGKILELRGYWDNFSMMQQLGVVTPPEG